MLQTVQLRDENAGNRPGKLLATARTQVNPVWKGVQPLRRPLGVQRTEVNIGDVALVRALQSMSPRGDCWDSVAETFFSTLELEGPPTTTWRYVVDTEIEMFNFIERYYNHARLHSYDDYRSSSETEAELSSGAAAA